MTALQPKSRGSTPAALAALLAVFLLGAPVFAHGSLPMDILPGDINHDGVINILDVQASINMALGATAATPEADVNGTGLVDVRDVQTLINTALGVGGLVQPLEGFIDLSGGPPFPIEVVAVSDDGRRARAFVDPETGYFRFTLAVGTHWSMGFFGPGGVALASVNFPTERYNAVTLPLLQLASGAIINLGTLPPTGEILAGLDLRALVAAAAEPLDLGDYSGSGLPDILDDLLFPLPVTIPFTGFRLPSELNELLLIAALAPCVEDTWGEPLAATLIGAELRGVPDFVAPVIQCFEAALRGWISEESLGIPAFFADLYVDYVMDTLHGELPGWLHALGRLDLEDRNGNFIPDYLEPYLCVPGVFGPCHLDANSNGIAEFLEDRSGNGIANLYDLSHAPEDDIDGDGVPNHLDIDADGDGVPNYADAEPLDPNVS